MNVNESFTRKTKQKSTEDIKQKADEHIGFKNLVKEIVLENDSFKENDKMSRIFRNRQPRCTHALNKLRVRPTSDTTLSPLSIQGMVVLDESFYFKPEKVQHLFTPCKGPYEESHEGFVQLRFHYSPQQDIHNGISRQGTSSYRIQYSQIQ